VKELLIMIVQCALLKCYTIPETVLLILPFLQTNITVQMRPSGGYKGEHKTYGKITKSQTA